MSSDKVQRSYRIRFIGIYRSCQVFLADGPSLIVIAYSYGQFLSAVCVVWIARCFHYRPIRRSQSSCVTHLSRYLHLQRVYCDAFDDFSVIN